MNCVNTSVLFGFVLVIILFDIIIFKIVTGDYIFSQFLLFQIRTEQDNTAEQCPAFVRDARRTCTLPRRWKVWATSTTSSASVVPPVGSCLTPGPSLSTTTRCSATPATGLPTLLGSVKQLIIFSIFFRKNFGPKGYGFGGGAGTLSMDDGKGYKSNPNAVDHKAKAYIAPKKPLVPSNFSTNVKGLPVFCFF